MWARLYGLGWSPAMIYGVLYDSMREMYRRQKIAPKYLDFYAITSLAGMEFLNGLSIMVVLAYGNIGSVRELFRHRGESEAVSALLAVSLLVVNDVYRRIRARSGESDLNGGARRPWIASVYMLCSVAAVIYARTLVSAFQK